MPAQSSSSPRLAPPRSGKAASERAARAVGLVEAVRRRKFGAVATVVTDAEASLERRIRAHLERAAVHVTLTDNHYTMISVRRVIRERRYDVRLHHMFADADPVITRALARYIADNDRDASRVLGDFIDGNQGPVRAQRSPTHVLITSGEVYDLREIFDDLNQRYFGGQIDAAITWGARNGKVRRRNSIKMGSYSVEERLIRIHRSLDRKFIPRFFVEWIVFHEMLHQVHDIKVKNGRREYHSHAFLVEETRFEHYRQARLWERAHIDALLTF
jgi:hypothetical protein